MPQLQLGVEVLLAHANAFVEPRFELLQLVLAVRSSIHELLELLGLRPIQIITPMIVYEVRVREVAHDLVILMMIGLDMYLEPRLGCSICLSGGLAATFQVKATLSLVYFCRLCVIVLIVE